MATWELDESSGLLTNFRGKVTDGFAGTDPRYMDGEVTLAQWTVEVEEVLQDFDGDVPDEVTISFPVGKDWFTENGTVLEHPKDKDKFHASTIYGKLLGAVSGVADGYGEIASRSDGEDLEVDLAGAFKQIGADDADPADIEIWEGLTFEFAEVEFDYGVNRKTKERMVSRRTMPVRFIGEGAGSKAKSTAKKATKATKASKATKATETAESPQDKVAAARARAAAKKAEAAPSAADNPFESKVDDEDLAARLLELFSEHDDHDGFVNAAAELPEVIADDDLLAWIIDEESGPWAAKS